AGGVGAVDDAGIDGSLDGFEHGLAGAFGGKVDGAGAVEVEGDAGLARGNEGLDHHLNVAAGQEVRGKIVDSDVEAAFDGGDAVIDDETDGDAAQAQGDEFANLDGRAGGEGADPDHAEVEDDDREDEDDQ